MRRFSSNSNARAIFRQGSGNAAYLLHLYELFQVYVASPPVINSIKEESKNTGGEVKVRYNLSFSTLALPCFNELYESFYPNGVKVVPVNIADLLSPISLAYWIMDDGSFTGNGIKLYTDAFSLIELDLLIKALDKNFKIKATINIHNSAKGQYNLYISKSQLPLVRSLVKEYIHPEMMYKLGNYTSA